MRFNSYEFLVFFAGVFVLAQFLRGRGRQHMLLVASYGFYASWNAPFVLLLIFSTFLDFTCGARIERSESKAQKRLCGRYQALNRRGLLPQKTCTAIARELTGFIWAIACEVMPKNATEARA